MNKFLLFLLILIIATIKLISQNALDSKGTDFWLAFPPNYHNIVSDQIDGYTDSLYIFLVASEATSGTIEYKNISGAISTHNFTITNPKEIYRFSVPYLNYELRGYNKSGEILDETSYQHQCERIAKQTFHIVCDKEINVYAHQQAITTSESMTCLPTDALGTNYLALSYNTNGFYQFNDIGGQSTPSQIVIIATEDTTKIEITPSAPTYINGNKKQNITLNKGEAYLVQADVSSANENGDLTGSMVKSDKPIVLISGHQRTRIPLESEATSRDMLLEMLPPVNAWGRNAIVTPFADNNTINNPAEDLFRVLSGADDVQISIDGEYITTLQTGDFFEFDLTQAYFIEASGPILVAQYKKSSQLPSSVEKTQSDPLIMITPPIEQYGNFYRVANIQSYERSTSGKQFPVYDYHYINVIVMDKDMANLEIDGNKLPANYFKKVPNSLYSYAILSVQPGTHELICPSGFGLSVYGYGFANSYGYYGGMNLVKYDFTPPKVVSNLDCYQVEGIASDSTVSDSKLYSLDFADSLKKNVTIQSSNAFPTPVAQFTAQLINKYLDGEFSVNAKDSSGLYTVKLVEIPGFTVNILDQKESDLPVQFIDSIPVGRELCYTFTLENYGKFDRTLPVIYLKYPDRNDTLFAYLPMTISSKNQTDIQICVMYPDTGATTFDLVLADSCSERVVVNFAISAFIDKFPPKFNSVVDDCNSVLTFQISELLKTDSGIESIAFTNEVNGKASIFNKTKSIIDGKFEVFNPRLDASFDLTATDSSGNKTTYTFEIPGFTLRYQINSIIDNKVDFQNKMIGYIYPDTIQLENYGKFDITLTTPKMFENTIFSVPQSQFPFTIPAGETKDLIVTYKPVSEKNTIDSDTLYLEFNCIVDKFIFEGIADPFDIKADSKCQVPLQFQADSIPLLIESSVKSTIVQSKIELIVQATRQTQANYVLSDIIGNTIDYGTFEIANGITAKDFVIEDYPSGILFLRIEINNQGYFYKLIKM